MKLRQSVSAKQKGFLLMELMLAVGLSVMSVLIIGYALGMLACRSSDMLSVCRGLSWAANPLHDHEGLIYRQESEPVIAIDQQGSSVHLSATWINKKLYHQACPEKMLVSLPELRRGSST